MFTQALEELGDEGQHIVVLVRDKVLGREFFGRKQTDSPARNTAYFPYCNMSIDRLACGAAYVAIG
jgi:hypothetical protein